MFKTIKSKFLVWTFVMLAVLMLAFVSYIGIFRMKMKQLMIQNYGNSINAFVQQLDDKVIRAVDNSKDLALLGSLYYKTDRSIPLTNKSIIKLFENYENSLGGGIWFEPYVVNKNQKRNCFYVYRNKNGKLILDEDFASDEYDYHNQGWYKQIMSQIDKKHDTAWSLPYYENQGSETMMITVGTGIFDGDKLIGLSTVDWELNTIFEEIKEMKPLEKGFNMYVQKGKIKDSFSLFASKKDNYIITTDDPNLDNNALVGKTLDNIPWYKDNLYYITYFDYNGKTYVPFVRNTINGMLLIINIPKSEMFKDIDKFVFNMFIVMAFLGIFIPILVYAGLNRYIINPIDKLTLFVKQIGKGEDVKIKIEKPTEFKQLASTFDKMTSDIKAITKEKEKINSELTIAKSIQTSSLPSTFPAFPNVKEFDIYASMEPAKEVGGDFYDYYFIDKNNNFMFLIADVSGKGVPAALFMMTTKTLINNLSQIGYEPKELIKIINKKVCENNKEGLFVTMFSGIVNIKTGKTYFVNCGHNKPLIKHQNGKYEYLELDNNMPLGVFEDTEFSIYETELKKGDIIFTYTDGITEAINPENEMYGENKLETSLNNIETDNINEIALRVKQNLKEYTKEAPQSDDITILCFKYNGEQKMNIKTYKDIAKRENYKPFCNWLHSSLKEFGVNKELFNKIDMCSEEIFANISFYAYGENEGEIEVSAQKTDNEIILKFEDSGIAYNPLEKPDPDITLPPMERPLGGLGIYMVKNMAKDVTYERNDNKNKLILIFEIL
ncbi:SpoIIE family protein phosphatase [bacterium]|nr:SpoIIE family protein phosphatase [bacterium]